jgi:hypothetical protein
MVCNRKVEFNNDGLIEKSNVYYGAEDCRRKVEGNRCLLKKAGFDNTLRIQLIYSLFSIGLYK